MRVIVYVNMEVRKEFVVYIIFVLAHLLAQFTIFAESFLERDTKQISAFGWEGKIPENRLARFIFFENDIECHEEFFLQKIL